MIRFLLSVLLLLAASTAAAAPKPLCRIDPAVDDARMVRQAAEASRPLLSGEELTYDTADGRFKIHYTLQGIDAVDPTDANENGLPDYIDHVAAGYQEGWQYLVEERGWHAPYFDTGAGGDTRIDVYVQEIDAYGYAHREPASCPEDCGLGAPGYNRIDNKNIIDPILPPAFLRSVCLHELTHLCQFATDTSEDSWWLEATASYPQALHYHFLTELPYAVTIQLQTRMERNWESLTRYGYANMVLAKFFADCFGDDLLPRKSWDYLGQTGGLDTISGLAAWSEDELGTSFDELYQEFTQWLYLSSRYDLGGRFEGGALARLPDWPSVNLDGVHGDFPVPWTDAPHAVQHYGASTVEFWLHGAGDGINIFLDPVSQTGFRPFGVTELAVGMDCQVYVFSELYLTQEDWLPNEDGAVEWSLDLGLPAQRVVLILQNLQREGMMQPIQWRYRAELHNALGDELEVAGEPGPPPGAVTSVEVWPSVTELAVNETRTWAAVARLDNCTNELITLEDGIWHAGDADVLQAADGGRLTGVADGVTEVWAEYDGVESDPLEVLVGTGIPAANDDDDDTQPSDDDDTVVNDDDDTGPSANDDDDDDGSSDGGCGCTSGRGGELIALLGLLPWWWGRKRRACLSLLRFW